MVAQLCGCCFGSLMVVRCPAAGHAPSSCLPGVHAGPAPRPALSSCLSSVHAGPAHVSTLSSALSLTWPLLCRPVSFPTCLSAWATRPPATAASRRTRTASPTVGAACACLAWLRPAAAHQQPQRGQRPERCAHVRRPGVRHRVHRQLHPGVHRLRCGHQRARLWKHRRGPAAG